MLEGGKITYKQLIFIIFISRIILTLTYFIAWSAPPGNQDTWLVSIATTLWEFIAVIPVYFLWKRFPDKTIIECSEVIMGKAGKIIGFLIASFFIFFTGITLAQFSAFLTSAIMPETPSLFFAIFMTVVCAYAARKGIEVIGRVSEIAAPIIIIAIISIVLLLAKDMKLESIFPLLEKGVFPVMSGGAIASVRTVEIVALAMFFPYLNERRRAKTVILVGFILIGIFLVMIDFTAVTILGPEMAKADMFPFYSAVRLINVGDFLQHLESIHMSIWVLGLFIKITLYYYLAVLGIGQVFNMKDYKPVVIPLSIIIILISQIIAPSIIVLRKVVSYKTYVVYGTFYILVIPSILLIVAMIRKKGVRGK